MSPTNWTIDKKVAALQRLPWTIRVERNPEEGYFVARVNELPSVIADGVTAEELSKDLWESLRETLYAFLEAGDPLPLPPRTVLPWESLKHPLEGSVYVGFLRGEAWEGLRSTTASQSGAIVEGPFLHEVSSIA